MRRLVLSLTGGVVGLIVGYYAGALFGCHILWPGLNLCGIPVIVTAPLGFVVGLLGARRWARPTS